MKVYLTLFFPPSAAAEGILEKWLCKTGTELTVGDALFSFHSGGKPQTLPSPAAGTIKVTLCREGETLRSGASIAVLSANEAQAAEIQHKGLGKIITPDEYQTTLSHAEAASIRLPPEEL